MRIIFAGLVLFFSWDSTAHPGIGLVRDTKGNIYYTDLKQVWKIDRNEVKTIAVPNVHTHELHLDKDDNLYGEHLWYNREKSDTWGHYVWCLRNNGKLDTIIPPTEGFLDNYSFNRDSSGNMYWVQRFTVSRFKKITPKGEITTIAEGKFKNIRWMHVTPAGTLYFIDLTDLYKIKDGGVKLMAKDLHERTSVFEYGSLQHNIFGIWLDKNENVYVAVFGGQVVKRITQDGQVSEVVFTSGGWRPIAGLFDDYGNLWLMEGNSGNEVRVRKITKGELSKPPFSLINMVNKARPAALLVGTALFFAAISCFIIKKSKNEAKSFQKSDIS